MNRFNPDGLALPPRRDTVAAAAPSVKVLGPRAGISSPIVVEKARDRLWDMYERTLMPEDVRNILASTVTGEMWQWERLYQAMFDSWPALQKCLSELQRDVRNAKWCVKPYCEQDQEPSEADEQTAKAASAMIWGARPRPTYLEGGMEDLMEWLTTAYWTGIGVSEVQWKMVKGEWRPGAYTSLSARHYGYSNMDEGADRLMLIRDPQAYGMFEDFPDHRFLIGVRRGHPGHPTVSAPLRVLTGYWLAAVFGLEWFMKFSQLFGVPLRWATYTDETAKDAVASMMMQVGSSGWGVGPAGTEVQTLESSKSATNLPQAELLRMADEQCEKFMLGQTLTSGVSEAGGSRALGEVHAETKHGVVKGICDFVGRILTSQLIPAWSYWNNGVVAENLPEFFPEWPEPKDEKAMAERDEKLGIISGETPVEMAWFYDRYGIPIPQKGAVLLVDEPEAEPAGPIDPKTGLPMQKEDEPNAHDPQDDQPKPGKVEASDETPTTLMGLLRAIPVADVDEVAEQIKKAALEGL